MSEKRGEAGELTRAELEAMERKKDHPNTLWTRQEAARLLAFTRRADDALKDLLDYVEQLELLAYDDDDGSTHEAVAKARSARLRP